MNTHETYVSLEIAKLLKEAGFDWEVYTYYSQRDNFKRLIHAESSPCNANEYREPSHYWQAVSAPTLSVAQRWLREVKNLILLIDITPSYCNGKPMGYKFVIHVSCGNHIWGEWKDTYEEALEAGIKKCLTLILEKNE